MPNDAAVAEKNLRRKIQALRRALFELVLYFLPPEFGGVGLGDLGIMCGNTNESLKKAGAIAKKSGFSEKNPGFDMDGDGATTSWDIEAWLNDTSRSTVPEMGCWGEGGCSFDYGVTNGDRLMQEEFLLGELQRLRVMEMDLLHEALAGEFDKVGSVLRPVREDLARAQTKGFLARALQKDGWPAAAAIAAVGVAAGGVVVPVGYAWQVLRGGWTLLGASDVDAGVQASEAQRGRSLDRPPLYNDLRRFGDRWQTASGGPSSNAPDEPPVHDDGPTGLVERAHRWSRALTNPFTRWFFCGSLLAPLVHDAAVLTWWRRVVADIDRGRLKPGRPSPVRLTGVAPVPSFSDDDVTPSPTGTAPPSAKVAVPPSPASEALPSQGVAMPPPRVPSAPAAFTPSAAGAPRVPAPPAPPRGVEIGPPGQRTFLGPDFEIRERVPKPINPAKVEAALRGEEVLMTQREFEAWQAALKVAQERTTGRPADLSEHEQALLKEYEEALASQKSS